MPFCSEVNQAMQDFTGATYNTSEQHIDVSGARQKRDCKDTEKLDRFLHTRNPFSKEDISLRSIVSGVVANESVNVDHAEDVRRKVLESMQGKCVNEYSFKQKQQATTIGSKKAVTLNKEHVQIDPRLLVQRLLVVAANKGRCIVVFDGYYDGPSVTDTTHLRRGSTNAVAVHCDLLSTFTVKKDVFLRNNQNKQCLINMLSEKLKEVGCNTIHAAGDADVTIALSAVSAAANRETVVIADDTDVLVLLCHHGNRCKGKIFLQPEPK